MFYREQYAYMYNLRRTLCATFVLAMLVGCSTSKNDALVSGESVSSTVPAAESVDTAAPSSTDGVPLSAPESADFIASLVEAVNVAAGGEDVNDAIIDATIEILQSEGKIDPTVWSVDTTPDTGTALKYLFGTADELPYCITVVGIDPPNDLDDVTTTEIVVPLRASSTVGTC